MKQMKKAKRKKILQEEEGRRRRESVLSAMLAVAGDFPHVPRPAECRTIAERSLEGLITFLTSYFRYLRTMDALHYLRLAKVDLLVAVRLIERGRHCLRKDAFSVRSHATKIALKCAALAARKPDMDAFLTASFSVAWRTLSAISLAHPADRRRLSVRDVCNLYVLLLKLPFDDSREQCVPTNPAYSRMSAHTGGIEKMPTGMEASLRSLLLDRIHALYLKAISRLPMRDLRDRHHRGLLKAGYCYGSFDPVTNIILNTIWYDTMFPVHQQLQVSMLCTELLVKIESLSLNGLVAAIRSCVPDVSKHGAMLYLLKSNVKVRKAISLAKQDGHVVSTSIMDAYKAAADASEHPEADAYVKFATECLPSIQSIVKSSLKPRRTISSKEIVTLSRLFSPSCSYLAKSPCSSMELTKEASEKSSSYLEKFTSNQGFVHGKIKAALLDYKQREGILYELQIICGWNPHVGSERSFMDDDHLFSHVNFWASANGSDSLTLFFAEFSNDDVGCNDQQSICYSVLDSSTNVRCCYCEFCGIRIIHPAFVSYQGSAMDFEKIALQEHSINMDNETIISHGKRRSSPNCIFGEEYIYFDPARDAKFIRTMNRYALEERIA